MFAKLSLLVLSLPLVSALTFNTPTNVVSGHEYTFTWTLNGYEPSIYYIALSGPTSQVLGNVTLNPGQTSITATPEVLPGNYILEASLALHDWIFAISQSFPVSGDE